MKTALILIFSMMASFSVFANDYETTMKESIEEMYQTQEPEILSKIAGKFYRIGEAEQDKWLPYYYAAYSYVSITYNLEDGDEIDAWLDKGQNMLDKAMELKPDEAENHVLQGLLYSMRITNPMRGMKFSGLSNDALAKAEKLEPENPRLWLCKAQNVYYTPSMFGGGAENAKPLFEKAAELFDTFEPRGELYPGWGKETNAAQLASINGE